MSATNNDKPAPVGQTSQPPQGQSEQYFPPPPPGPPPALDTQAPAPKHPNETPLTDYDIPPYDPAHPSFAPPPPPPGGGDDLYNATPTDEHPPQFPPPAGEQQHHHQGHASKPSWSDKLSGWGSKAAGPFNALANKMGSETFFPAPLDKECEKAARILKSFCKDGIYNDAPPTTDPAHPTAPSTTDAAPPQVSGKTADAKAGKKPKVLLTIPSKVIAKAQGLAIFTTVRAGFQVSGSSGSGILIARLPDGSWSPPSGIQVHSVGAGFVIGLDIYDCVVVINSKEALEAFTRTRMSLGSDLAVTAGPWGAGGALDWGVPQNDKGKERATNLAPPSTSEQQQPQVTTGPAVEAAPKVSTAEQGSSKNRKPSPFREAIKKPVYSYVKSRGFYAGVQVDGTVVTERKEANAAFYGQPISVEKILKGEVPAQGPKGMWPTAAQGLFEVLKGAEGWRGQQQHAHGANAAVPVAAGATVAAPAMPAQAAVPDVTAGVGGLSLGESSTAPQTQAGYSKAAEAAAEAAAAAESGESSSHPPPPAYSEPTGDEDLPPAYVDDGVYRPGVGDSKTGLH